MEKGRAVGVLGKDSTFVVNREGLTQRRGGEGKQTQPEATKGKVTN